MILSLGDHMLLWPVLNFTREYQEDSLALGHTRSLRAPKYLWWSKKKDKLVIRSDIDTPPVKSEHHWSEQVVRRLEKLEAIQERNPMSARNGHLVDSVRRGNLEN